MFAKTGLSVVAAAGVAFGVVGMTMGGASGATTSCLPAHAASANANRHANADHSASSRNDSSNAADNSSATDGSSTGAEGTDNGGVTDPTNSGTTVAGGATVPDGTTPVADTPPSTSSGDLPLLHLSEHTSSANAAGSSAPPTGTSVIGRSSNVSGLHIFGNVNQG